MILLQPIRKALVRIAGSTLLRKIADAGSCAAIFFSATQLGYHFWPSFAFIYGVRVDYLSPTLYFLDLLVTVVFICRRLASASSRPLLPAWLLALLPLFLINLLNSGVTLPTLIWIVRLFLYVAFINSLSSVFISKLLIPALSFSLIFQLFLSSVQFVLGQSVQGPFYWLGERALSVGSPNVAKADWFGSMVMRSYGTFSHPNILAGWLVIVFAITAMVSRGVVWRVLMPVFIFVGLILTRSRSAALSFFGFLFPGSYVPRRFRRLSFILFLAGVLFYISFLSFSGLSVSERLSLQSVSLKIFLANLFFGTGANASISQYPLVSPGFRLLQPDHDSFTLLLSWFGLAGPLSFVILAGRVSFRHLKKYLFLLPLLLLDHYFLTSIQGLFILLLFFRASSLSDQLANRRTGN